MPIKVEEDYYADLLDEKAEEYSKESKIPYEDVLDILLEGWDLACAYYENNQGKVKESIIREQYPELFEKEYPKFNILNTPIVKDRIGYILGKNNISPYKADKILKIYHKEINKELGKYYQVRTLMLETLENVIEEVLKPDLDSIEGDNLDT